MNEQQKEQFVSNIDNLSYDERIEILKNFKSSRGWQLVKRVLEDNKSYLEHALLNGEDPVSGQELTDQETKRLRDKLSYLKDLLNTPETFIDKLEHARDADEEEEPDLDPYHTDATEMRKEKS